ncbi:hypothetical protein AB6D05_03960 [Vibrio cyclitrophicus]
MKEKILLIGKTPPPIGGVSVFVLRYYNKLSKDGFPTTLFPNNKSSNFIILIKLLFNSYDRIVLNTMSFPVLIFLFISFNLKKVELVDHNHSRKFKSDFKTKIILHIISKVKRINLVDEHLKLNYPQGFFDFEVINPFIEPTEDEVLIAKKKLPIDVSELFDRTDKVFIISAWKLILEEGSELYGIERTCNVFEKLLISYPNIGLIVCIGDPNENIFLLNRIKSKVGNLSNIIFWENCSTSWNLFSEKTIYLRPTSTDGNSISIHEAIFYNSAVIASDVVPRPPDCVIFEYNNNSDYIKKIKLQLETKNETNTTKHIKRGNFTR